MASQNESQIADLTRLAEQNEWIADNSSIAPSAGQRLRESAARYRQRADDIREEAELGRQPRRWARR